MNLSWWNGFWIRHFLIISGLDCFFIINSSSRNAPLTRLHSLYTVHGRMQHSHTWMCQGEQRDTKIETLASRSWQIERAVSQQKDNQNVFYGNLHIRSDGWLGRETQITHTHTSWETVAERLKERETYRESQRDKKQRDNEIEKQRESEREWDRERNERERERREISLSPFERDRQRGRETETDR